MMFTGIVTELGTVVSGGARGGGRRLQIEAPSTSGRLRVGDSVAVNGVCLTAVLVEPPRFSVDVIPETLNRTGLGAVVGGSRVNLERPMPADGRFDGHVVQGHVDGVGRVISVDDEGTSRRMRVSLPANLTRYTVEKGSISVDGVSLTITEVSAPLDHVPYFEVALIPHTLEVTALGGLMPGDEVNIEVDVIAKYVARMLETSR